MEINQVPNKKKKLGFSKDLSLLIHQVQIKNQDSLIYKKYSKIKI